jgi:hypothetical protein
MSSLSNNEFVKNTVNTAKSLMREAVEVSDGKMDKDVLHEKITEITKDLKDALDKDKEKTSSTINAMGVKAMMKVMCFYIDQIKALKEEEVQDMNKKDKYSSILDKSIENKDKFVGWLVINCTKAACK